jgi:signal recognition particle subunit SRP68
LGTVGNVEQQVLCRERVEELEPSIRYCKYKSSGSGVQKEELSELSNQEGPGMDILQSKLEVTYGSLADIVGILTQVFVLA